MFILANNIFLARDRFGGLYGDKGGKISIWSPYAENVDFAPPKQVFLHNGLS